MARRALDRYQPITTVHGEPGYGYFGKHAGYDYGVVYQPVKAPEAGVITNVLTGREHIEGGNIIELRSSKYDHRFLHLDSAKVKVGDKVREGQILGTSGNTGDVGFHLHHDVRKKGTVWNDKYSNYVDWESIISEGEHMTRNQMTNMKWLAIRQPLRQGVTDAEYTKYKNNISGWIDYLSKLQGKYNIVPRKPNSIVDNVWLKVKEAFNK